MKLTRKLASVAAAGGLALALTACGADEVETPDDLTPDADPTPTETEDATGAAAQVFGPGCADVPTDGAGSFDGMVEEPVATAASGNPLLSTLVTAVTEADLVDTLNGADGITVFAPANSAFDAIPEEDLNALLADQEALGEVLTHHVVAGQLSPEDVAGTHETLNGDSITVEGADEEFTVEDANVVCGNVPTANATVYIIDGVLMP